MLFDVIIVEQIKRYLMKHEQFVRIMYGQGFDKIITHL
jgi:hypothetical protein